MIDLVENHENEIEAIVMTKIYKQIIICLCHLKVNLLPLPDTHA